MKVGKCQAWYSHEEAAAILNPKSEVFMFHPHLRSVSPIRCTVKQTLLEFEFALPELVGHGEFQEIKSGGIEDVGTQPEKE